MVVLLNIIRIFVKINYVKENRINKRTNFRVFKVI